MQIEEITSYFIVPIFVIVLIPYLMGSYKQGMSSTRKMTLELAIVSVYLAIHFSKALAKEAKYYVFLGAIMAVLSMCYYIITKLRSPHENKMTCAVEAASKAAVESIEKSTSENEAKVTASVNGATAAAKAARDEGMSEKEITKAAMIGQVVGSMTADSVSKIQ
jgi:uncharacterized protein (UPF0333 family)